MREGARQQASARLPAEKTTPSQGMVRLLFALRHALATMSDARETVAAGY
jgi:hypothetical protein